MTPFTKTLKSGTHLFRENDRSRELYIIQSGSVKVYRTAGGKEIPLATLEKGAVLGEMALIDGKPRSASVKTLEDTTVIIIDADTFHNRVKGIPAWFLSIVRSTSIKIRQANRRLQSISSDHQGARIIITLSLYFRRFDEGQNGLPAATIQHHLIQLLGATYLDITNTLDFLCRHSFITLSKDSIHITDGGRLQEYCEYLRFFLRKQFDDMDPEDERLGRIARLLIGTSSAFFTEESSFTQMEGNLFYNLLKSNSLDDFHLDLIDHLQKSGYITCTRKGKSTDNRPLSDCTIRHFHLPWKRAYLYYKFNEAAPE